MEVLPKFARHLFFPSRFLFPHLPCQRTACVPTFRPLENNNSIHKIQISWVECRIKFAMIQYLSPRLPKIKYGLGCLSSRPTLKLQEAHLRRLTSLKRPWSGFHGLLIKSARYGCSFFRLERYALFYSCAVGQRKGPTVFLSAELIQVCFSLWNCISI